MKKRLLCFLFLAGCGNLYVGNQIPGPAMQALQETDRTIVYTIDPDTAISPTLPVTRVLDGFAVKEKDVLTDDYAREAGAVVQDAVNTARGTTNCVFKPEYGVRVRHDYRTYDFLMSYNCGIVEIFEDHKSIAWHGMDGEEDDLDGIIKDSRIRPAGNGK